MDRSAMSEAARQMGSVRSAKKAAAVRENGKRGGRPVGTPQSQETREKIAQAARERWAKHRGETH